MGKDTNSNETVDQLCPCLDQQRDAIKCLNALRDDLEAIVIKFPHYAGFIRDICLAGFGHDVGILVSRLEAAEEARTTKTTCRQCDPNAK